MNLIWKFGLLGLFAACILALDARFPSALEDKTAQMSLTLLGISLATLIFAEGRPRRCSAAFEKGRAMIVNVTIWLLAVAVLVVAYDNREGLHRGALKVISGWQPSAPTRLANDETVLMRTGAGHFTATVMINDKQVEMLVDTGATDVALPYLEARRVGVDVARLDFVRPVMTANGEAMVAPVMLDHMTVGDITVHDVRASVAEPGRLGGALLGMSFLGRLSEVTFRGDTLVLRK